MGAILPCSHSPLLPISLRVFVGWVIREQERLAVTSSLRGLLLLDGRCNGRFARSGMGRPIDC